MGLEIRHLEHELPSDFDPQVVAEIKKRLNRVREDGCAILFAVESGSRAWGFPSPDSDYDCRFVYARPIDDHLLLNPHRDVIEFPIVGDVDTGGWDLKKALLLALSGNAAICEWMDSQICYEEIPRFRTELKEVLSRIVDPIPVSHHYLGLARSGLSRHSDGESNIKLKKIFYLLRPLIALTWMQERDFKQLPPISFTSNLDECHIEDGIREEINLLLELKRQTRELGTGTIPKRIKVYIQETFYAFDANIPKTQKDPALNKANHAIAQEFYTQVIKRFT